MKRVLSSLEGSIVMQVKSGKEVTSPVGDMVRLSPERTPTERGRVVSEATR